MILKFQVDAEEAAILSTIFDVGGIIGGIIAGMLSDKTGKPASTCAIMLVTLKAWYRGKEAKNQIDNPR